MLVEAQVELAAAMLKSLMLLRLGVL